MKETYEQLKMDVVVFDADIRTATADGVGVIEASGRERTPTDQPTTQTPA